MPPSPLELVRQLAARARRFNPNELSKPQIAEFKDLSRRVYTPQHNEAKRKAEKWLELAMSASSPEQKQKFLDAYKRAEYEAARYAKLDQAATNVSKAKLIYDEDLRAITVPGQTEGVPGGIATFYPPGHYVGDPLLEDATYLELLGTAPDAPGAGRVLLRQTGLSSPSNPMLWHSTSYPETLGFYESRGGRRIPFESIPKESDMRGSLPAFRIDRGDMIKEKAGGPVKMAGGGALSRFGRGWFMNKSNKLVKELTEGDMGLYGDHDGWISIAKNAVSLGVDPRDAKTMQRGNYGFYLPRKMTKEWIEQGGTPMMEKGRAFYWPMMGDKFEPADELFFRLYGQFPDEAAQGGVLGAGSTLDALLRARLWPNKIMSLDSASGVEPSDLRNLWDVIGGGVERPEKIRVSVDSPSGELLDLPLMDALTKKRWATGGLVRYARSRA